MIELKNVSAKTVIPYNAYSIKKLVEETRAESAQDVLELINEYPEYNWFSVIELFGKVKREMNLANKRGSEPKMFYTKGYNIENLKQQDLINYGNILLLDSPIDFKTRHCSLRDKSITQIKTDLAHTTSSGKNYVIAANCDYRNIGINSIPKIISSIEMYEQQIERQARLTSERDVNLFELHRDTKMDITEEMYNEIIMYLVYNTEERLVWGKLTNDQKMLYLSSTIYKKQQDELTRQRIKEYIANYTTLLELEKVADHDLEVLHRFIIK